MKNTKLITSIGLIIVACAAVGFVLYQPSTQNNTQIPISQEVKITAPAVDTRQVYVTPQWVQSVISGNQPESENYIILECSWGEIEDSPTYTNGHLEGALHLNTDSIESEEFWNIREPEEIAALFAEYGITKDTTVIVYGTNAVDAADDRVATVALWAGVENVKVMDGGLDAYIEAGFPLETKINETKKWNGEFGAEIPVNPQYFLSLEDTVKALETQENFALISIRSYEEFLGHTSGYSYISKAGEPKGAVWGHDTDDASYANADGTVVDLNTLLRYLSVYDVSEKDNLAFYCGTSWRASIPFLICYQEGMENITLFDGGWFQWQKNDDLAVQIGDPTTGDVKYATVGDLSTDKAR